MNSITKKLSEIKQFIQDYAHIINPTIGLIIGISYSATMCKFVQDGSMFSSTVTNDYHDGLIIGDAIILFAPMLGAIFGSRC